MKASSIFPIAIAAVAAVVVAVLGETMTNLGPWYIELAKPEWTPPNFVFPIAWTIIFALAAIAGVSAWRQAPNTRMSDTVVGMFALNGFLNILWSLLFFRLQRPDWAFYEVILLGISVAALIIYCWRFSKLTSLLLLPYLAWVCIAGTLNWQVVQLNSPFG